MTIKTNTLDPAHLPDCPGGRGWPCQTELRLPAPADQQECWPRITIVTPSFNQADFLEQTIRSVLLQGYPNLEYIVLDGGSSDGSIDVIRKYEPWIDYWCSGKDAGQADAIYRGFERSTGEVVAWQNSDDLYLPGALLEMGRVFKSRPQVELAIGGCLWIDPAGKPLRSRRGNPLYYPGRKLTFRETLLWGMGYNQPATFYRRDAFFAAGGFDRSLQCCFDYDSILRLTRRQRAYAVRRPVACFRLHGESKTARQQKAFAQELERVRNRFEPQAPPEKVRQIARQFYCKRDVWARRWFLFRDFIGSSELSELTHAHFTSTG